MALDIHNYNRVLEQERAALAKAPTSERNKIAILDLVQELALRGISLPRQIKYLGWLRRLAVLLGKDFHEATVDDIKKLVLTFEQRREYSAWTRKDLRVLLKRLYGHLRHTPAGSSAPEVAWMSTRIACQDLHVPAEGQLLTQDEVHRLIGHATNLRDKAYISLLWESGCRVGELGNMQLKHVTFDASGAILSVRGKTGSRQVRIIFSVPHLANWTACHPHADNPEAPLWAVLTKNRVRPLNYGYLRIILQKLAERAGINKRVYPHLFRHSRATLSANYLTEFQMNHYFGWKQGSSMPSTYVHMSGRNIDKTLLAMNGLPTTSTETSKPEGSACHVCKTYNTITATTCRACGNKIRHDPAEPIPASVNPTPHQQVPTQLIHALLNEMACNPDFVAIMREHLKVGEQQPSTAKPAAPPEGLQANRAEAAVEA